MFLQMLIVDIVGKFHKEVDLLNSKGINVHYLAFPRAGQKVRDV